MKWMTLTLLDPHYHTKGTVATDLVAAAASGVDVLIHYTMMLLAMSFNVYILVCLAVGHSLGSIVNHQLQRSSEAASKA